MNRRYQLALGPAKRRLAGWSVPGAVVLLLMALMAACSRSEAPNRSIASPSQTSSSVVALSSELPDFPITLYQGGDIIGSEETRFAGLLGQKPIVLNHWASNCPPCSAEMPEFEKVWQNYKDRVLFFGLDVGRFVGLRSPEDSMQELRRLGVTYPAAPVPDMDTIRGLQVQGLPSTYFITPKGKIHHKWVGTLNEKKLTELVEALLKASS